MMFAPAFTRGCRGPQVVVSARGVDSRQFRESPLLLRTPLGDLTLGILIEMLVWGACQQSRPVQHNRLIELPESTDIVEFARQPPGNSYCSHENRVPTQNIPPLRKRWLAGFLFPVLASGTLGHQNQRAGAIVAETETPNNVEAPVLVFWPSLVF